MPIELSNEANLNLESDDIKIRNENGKNVGTVRGLEGKFGIGLCRIENCLSAQNLMILDKCACMKNVKLMFV